LKSVGHQRQLTIVLSQQGREAGNAEIAGPFEISDGGIAGGLRIEAIGELDARNPGGFGQLNQLLRQRDIAPFDIERALNQPGESPSDLRIKTARSNQCPASGLGVIDQPFWKTRLEVEGLTARLVYRMPIRSRAVASGLIHHGTLLAQSSDDEICTYPTSLRLLDQRLHDRRKAPAP